MEQLFQFSFLELVVAGITTVLFVILLLYWLISYSRPLRRARREETIEPTQPPVSVIVYAKNESENLQKNLPALLTQDYPEYEVVVINDGSTDESDDVLKRFELEYKHLYHTYIPEDVKYLSRKKLALTVGIKAAKHDILLFTEANCKPLSSDWIASVAGKYKANTEIVLGFCAYGHHKGFLHRLIAYDNLKEGLQMFTSALVRKPYTGNGRNLSYLKALFFQHKGYQRSLALHAGDDDLFVNESANKRNTEVVYMPNSIVEMNRIERFKIWKEMKVSRAATKRYYKGGSLPFFRMEEVLFFLFVLAVIASVVVGLSGNWLIAVLAGLLYLIRFVVKVVIFHKSSKLLKQKPPGGWLLLLEIIAPLFDVYVRIYRLFRGKNDYTFRMG
ncbi:glycosyltransferase [Parabacteroides sp. OttesenSCG-928-G07]|nr:glycosyltransferase [Parabacteroides sp. OttesenSCG-928-G21]MDL2278661.1 glycosyltransferase [Parabacteroides sp. OttesenSCG-928-G07]